MKLVLSRKGFDSSFGGCASPILPDGQMLSLPIPDGDARVQSQISYRELRTRNLDVGQLVSDLTREPASAGAAAHLDPDLELSARSRQAGWSPAFGQDGKAQRHLDACGVSVGDLFLFFGWFREVELIRGKYRYRVGAPDRHILFGWLRIGHVLRVDLDPLPAWLETHPHAGRLDLPFNTIYVADSPDDAGVFPKCLPPLVLTEPEKSRSTWRLPSDFMPRSRPPLTYHRTPTRWTEVDGGCRLQSVAKGQEFVLNLNGYPGVQRWAESIVSLAG